MYTKLWILSLIILLIPLGCDTTDDGNNPTEMDIPSELTHTTPIDYGNLMGYVPALHKVFITVPQTSEILVVDTQNWQVTASISESSWYGVLNDAVYVPEKDKVLVGLSNYEYDNAEGGTAVINPHTNAVEQLIQFEETEGQYQYPEGCALVVSPDGTRVYSLEYDKGGVTIIKTSDWTKDTFIPVSYPKSADITPDGHYLIVICDDTPSICIIDTQTKSICKTISGEEVEVSVLCHPTRSEAYISLGPPDRCVKILDTTSWAFTASIVSGTTEHPLTAGNMCLLPPDYRYLYIAPKNEDPCDILDIVDRTYYNYFLTDGGGNDLFVEPDGSGVAILSHSALEYFQ